MVRVANDPLPGSGQEPVERRLHHGFRHDVAVRELAVVDVVAGVPEPRHEAAAAALDREHRVAHPVRDEDLRQPARLLRRCETGRKRENIAEQVAIRDPKRQRVGRSVGKSSDADAMAVHRVMGEHISEGVVDERHVRTVAAENDIPGPPAGVRRKDQETPGFSLLGKVAEHGTSLASRPVKQDEQGSRALMAVAQRHQEKAVALSAVAKRQKAPPDLRCGILRHRPGREATTRRGGAVVGVSRRHALSFRGPAPR